jgi:hypothetical protein
MRNLFLEPFSLAIDSGVAGLGAGRVWFEEVEDGGGFFVAYGSSE